MRSGGAGKQGEEMPPDAGPGLLATLTPAVSRVAVATLLLWSLGAVALRLTVLHAESCPSLSPDQARAAALAAGDWIVRNQRPDGTFLYEYDRVGGVLSGDYNMVRHAGVTMSLYQLVRAGEGEYLAAADRGLAFMQANLAAGDGWVAFGERGSSRLSLGANALFLAALAQRRLATGETLHDSLMEDLGRFILELQREDGSFLAAWDLLREAPVPGFTSRYATGEAFWALTLMAALFPGQGWDGAARRVGTYLATRRDAAEDLAFPPWADQWAAYGFAELGQGGSLTESDGRYLRALAARFGLLVRFESKRGEGWVSSHLRGPRARAAGLGTWVEGLGSLARLARRVPSLAPGAGAIRSRAVCAAAMLVDRQVKPGEGDARRGGLELGAWFSHGRTRMDDQQHAISGLLLVEAMLGGER